MYFKVVPTVMLQSEARNIEIGERKLSSPKLSTKYFRVGALVSCIFSCRHHAFPSIRFNQINTKSCGFPNMYRFDPFCNVFQISMEDILRLLWCAVMAPPPVCSSLVVYCAATCLTCNKLFDCGSSTNNSHEVYVATCLMFHSKFRV